MRIFNASGGFLSIMAICAIVAGTANAVEDASRLGKELTPAGGEMAGNKDGTIPAYTGRSDTLPGWSYGKPRGDYWTHKDDKPLFSIDAGNVNKYADKLTDGQIATIHAVKGYRMDIYPTRRSCTVPDFVAENTKKNTSTARLSADKTTIDEAVVPGYPFPIPSSGIEAMLNSKMRYRGLAIDFPGVTTVVSPRKGGSESIRIPTDYTYVSPWAAKGSVLLSSRGMVEKHIFVSYMAPPALAGQALAITDYFDKASETFYYFPGQRRVRRMPSYTYDAPQIGFENQYLMDEPNMFTGRLDRFDWKIVGKKETFVPYNVFGAYQPKVKEEEFIKPDTANPALLRYELHRVWVIEATVKSGARHMSPKRRYYLDEDSWNILLAEHFDAQGKLWRTSEGFIIPIWELGGACDVEAFIQHNLTEGRYLVDSFSTGSGKDIQWHSSPSSPRHNSSYYTSDNLRAVSDR